MNEEHTMNARVFQNVGKLLAIVSILSTAPLARAQNFVGLWKFDPGQSKHVAGAFQPGELNLRLQILSDSSDRLVIETMYRGEYGGRMIKLNVDLSGKETNSFFPRGDLPMFSYEAVEAGDDPVVKSTAVLGADKTSLDVTSHFTVNVSQGSAEITRQLHFQLSQDGETLTMTEMRNSRDFAPPAVYVFDRAD